MEKTMSTILLAEQSMPNGQRLGERLSRLGYQVTSVADAELVHMVKIHPYDMIIWVFGEWDPMNKETISHIRKFSDAPLLTVRVWEDQEKLFDGCIELSFDQDELETFINEYLREAYHKSHNVRLYQYKGLKINNGSIKKIEMNQKSLDLTVKEFMILSLLMCHRECIYTKASLYEAVWRQPYMGDDNALKIHISNLRSKLKKADPDEEYIETVRGQGYRLCRN